MGRFKNGGRHASPNSEYAKGRAPRQKEEEDRMEMWKTLKSPRPKKPAVHGGLKDK